MKDRMKKIEEQKNARQIESSKSEGALVGGANRKMVSSQILSFIIVMFWTLFKGNKCFQSHLWQTLSSSF